SRGRRMEAYHCRVLLRRPESVLLAAWLFAAAGQLSHAQTASMHREADMGAIAIARPLPEAPVVPTAEEVGGGAICGTVLDANGAEVGGATVMLEGANGKDQMSATTDDNGFFRFSSVAPGSFKVTV